jgi:hypothetical protein
LNNHENQRAYFSPIHNKGIVFMLKLQLHYKNFIQGMFELKQLNLLLVFQVNCPGCFFYALPTFNKLYANLHHTDISFLGLSTAFEDFDENTYDNTKKLVNKGELIGETKKTMALHNMESLPFAIDFPIAMDKIVTSINNNEPVINHICNINPNFKIWSEYEQIEQQQKVILYLNSLEYIPLTFTLNQLKGTPSLILFNSSYEILNSWFGMTQYEDIIKSISYHDKKVSL